jgi:HicB_like antitoxin of bacterial toxin-antitoxin system
MNKFYVGIYVLYDLYLCIKISTMTRHFPILIEQDEDNIFIVTCPTFKGCHSYGKTIDEALANIREVIEMCAEE